METQGTYQVSSAYVRGDCLRLFAEGWVAPTAPEVRQVLQMAGLDPRAAGDFLGVSRRQVNRWTTAEEEIAYSCWVMLCQRAGIGYLVGQAAPQWREPEREGVRNLYRFELDRIHAIEVYGRPEMAWYEWRGLMSGEQVAGSEDAGYGDPLVALRDALNWLLS
ncbi:hypothetical protein [Pseudomonas aeruginosa]|uniref:hypothetical protein n=1 Tax=Pseudomonas aeruginosa TaxID=287 RepID=UPI00106D338C|nr:hypothetical protein [Pseudomonas aeruginosa]HBO7987867.1 hypothetical protein [Pseudomonas aeruginosa]HBO8740680.1 hypothetical protein [Pseudomonas aeruginosa]HDY6109637.1 hypothetical protein [Pseudomonas aeruginosa]HDY6417813.1 hypothetical protein [Pseudomonas aeruginosa]HDY6504527.1 hypothetical protein [Pseudomonas aeruginosa]